MFRSFILYAVINILVAVPQINAACAAPDNTCYQKPSAFSRDELSKTKDKFNKPVQQNPDKVKPGLDLTKLNPLHTKLHPQKNMQVSIFSSMREIFVFSILGLFGLLGSSGLYGLYRAIKKNKRK
jgi:hypothetical protein